MPRVLLAWALCLCACGPLTFNTTVQGETVVPGNVLGGLLSVFPGFTGFGSIDFSQNQDFKNQKVERDHVRSVVVESLQVKVLSPSDQDFGFIDSLQFFARSGETEALFAEKLNVASLGIPTPNPVLNLDLPPADLAPFVREPAMSLVMRGRGRQPPTDVRLQATVKLRVQAQIF